MYVYKIFEEGTLPRRFIQASTDIPANTTAAPSHCPLVNLWLYTMTERIMVKSFRVSVMVLWIAVFSILFSIL